MWRSRMMHVLFFEESERGTWTFRARPLLFELTASIQYFGRHRRTRVYQSRFARSFFPHGREIARGLVLINQLKFQRKRIVGNGRRLSNSSKAVRTVCARSSDQSR